MGKHYLLVIWNSRELIAPFFTIVPCPYILLRSCDKTTRFIHSSCRNMDFGHVRIALGCRDVNAEHLLNDEAGRNVRIVGTVILLDS